MWKLLLLMRLRAARYPAIIFFTVFQCSLAAYMEKLSGFMRLCLGILFSSSSVKAQDTSGVLTSTANFLDSGLATIGSIAAWGTTLARGRLDFEMGLRDLVHSEVEMTLVDKWSEARHGYAYTEVTDIQWRFNLVHVGEAAYAASNVLVDWLVHSYGSRVLQIAGKWLRDELSPLDCSDVVHMCHCLCLPKETYQFMGLLSPDNPNKELCRDLSDSHFVLLCGDCAQHACHTSLAGDTIRPFQGISTCTLEAEELQLLSKGAESRARRSLRYWISLSDVLPPLHITDSKAVENFVILSDWLTHKGTVKELGLTSIPTADESSRQALPTVCATLQEMNRAYIGLQMLEWKRHPLRYPFLLMVEAVVQWMLVIFLHLDSFSSALATRKLFTSLISDSTSTRSPIEATIPEARLGWDSGDGFSFGYAIRRWYLWRARAIRYLPSCANFIAMIVWCILVARQVDVAFYSNAYTGAVPRWTVIYALFTSFLSLLITVFGTAPDDPQWSRLRRLRVVGACVQGLVIVFLVLHVATHWRVSSRRVIYPIMLMGASCQWFVGAAHIGSHAGSIYSYSWRHSVLYSCAFLQLSSLTSIGGKWK